MFCIPLKISAARSLLLEKVTSSINSGQDAFYMMTPGVVND